MYRACGIEPSASFRCLFGVSDAGRRSNEDTAREDAITALELRIGIHTDRSYRELSAVTFDIWGDAVNTAALMEAAAGSMSETVAARQDAV
jgi:class 3 adenylate cyclase